MEESFTRRISASWGFVRSVRGSNSCQNPTCSWVKEDGQPPPSYQNLSPYLEEAEFQRTVSLIGHNYLKLWNCLPMMQAKVGPTMEPGRGRSLMPAVHRSMSSGLA